MQDSSDMGKKPYVVDLEELTEKNDKFRVTKWTGEYLQMTVMSLKPGEDVGLEVHNDHDQFLRLEAGTGKVVMGPGKDQLDQEWEVEDDFAIFVPAGTWHNITNTGDELLKLYSIYAPGDHKYGTVHETKADAEVDEAEH